MKCTKQYIVRETIYLVCLLKLDNIHHAVSSTELVSGNAISMASIRGSSSQVTSQQHLLSFQNTYSVEFKFCVPVLDLLRFRM